MRKSDEQNVKDFLIERSFLEPTPTDHLEDTQKDALKSDVKPVEPNAFLIYFDDSILFITGVFQIQT